MSHYDTFWYEKVYKSDILSFSDYLSLKEESRARVMGFKI